MKKTRKTGGREMKKIFAGFLGLLVVSCLVLPMAHAVVWGYELGNPIFGPMVYSPDALSSAVSITNVSVAPSGTVTVGTFVSEGSSQPIGLYGVGVSLSAFSAAEGFHLAGAPQLFSYDSAAFDVFYAVITQGGYLWDVGIGGIVGGETWGGTTEGGLEGLTEPWSIFSTVMLTPASDYYYNIALETTSDVLLPSYGQFGDVAIAPIPEPATMLLIGSGLLGLGGMKFRKKRKV